MLSDHPDAAGRAKAARSAAQGGRSAFPPAEWAAIKAACPVERTDEDQAPQPAKASLHRRATE